MEQAIRELQEWAATEVPNSRRDDVYLKRFLQGCKMRQEIARNKLKNIHKLQLETPQWFSDRDPTKPRVMSLLELGVFIVMPQKDEGGHTIVLVRATRHDPRTTDMEDVFKVGMMVVDLALEEDISLTSPGVIVLIDLKNVQAGHALQLKTNLIRRAVHSWQECYPVRIHSFHFLNCPGHVWLVVNIFKQFMREKLKRRVHTYGKNLAKLYDTVPHSLLPNELNGTLGTIDELVVNWKTKIIESKEWFLAQEKALTS